MMCIRSLLGLFFLLNIALQDFSLAQQVLDGSKLVLAEDHNVVSATEKEIVDGLKAARKFGFGTRRKMIVEEVKKKKKLENEKESSFVNGGRASKKENENSGAKCKIDHIKCEYEVKKKRFSVKCEIRDNNNSKNKLIKECGFVAFGDDYQAPKHHTPNHH